MLMCQPEGISACETQSWVVLIAGGEEKSQGILFLARHQVWERVSLLKKVLFLQKTFTKELISVVSSLPLREQTPFPVIDSPAAGEILAGKGVSSYRLWLYCGRRICLL